MNIQDRLRINVPKIVHETIDGETIILNLKSGNYYSLNGIAAEVWAFIEKGASMNDIIEQLLTDYQGVKEDIASKVNTFLSELILEELASVDALPSTEAPKCTSAQAQAGPNHHRPAFNAPILTKYSDMKDLLLLDPIHDADDTGWPESKPALQTNTPSVEKQS